MELCKSLQIFQNKSLVLTKEGILFSEKKAFTLKWKQEMLSKKRYLLFYSIDIDIEIVVMCYWYDVNIQSKDHFNGLFLP